MVGGIDEFRIVVSIVVVVVSVVSRGGGGHLIPVGIHAVVVDGVVVVALSALDRGCGRHRHGKHLRDGGDDLFTRKALFPRGRLEKSN